MFETPYIDVNQHAHFTLSAPTLGLVLSEEERKERLAYWISDTIRRRRLTAAAPTRL